MEAEAKKDEMLIGINNIGISFFEKKKGGEASKKKEGTKKDESKEKAIFDKGKWKVQYHKAIENYENDLSTNPQDAFNLKQLALLYKKVGKFDKSIEAIDKLLVMEPENEDYKKEKISIEKLKEEKNELKKKKKKRSIQK